MRIEQVIAAVARPVAVAIVREMKAVVSFVRDTDLHHLWLQRMPQGMPAYACVSSSTSTSRGCTAGIKREMCGNQVGRLLWSPSGDQAFSQTGFDQA
jgi:hypothetical protein